jgi:hypothetical protein
MASSLILSTLRDRVEAFLADSSNAVWATGTLDEAARLALHEYSSHRPQRVYATLTLSAASREVALSTLTGLLTVQRVWFPYTAADPEVPPKWIKFEVWDNAGALTLYLDVAADPAAGEVARVFYTKPQALKDLDSASASTFPAEDDSLIVMGAAGYAAGSELIDQAGSIRIDTKEYDTLKEFGRRQLDAFRETLRRPARAGMTL